MSEELSQGLSLEATLESQPIAQAPAVEEPDDAEPDGVIDVQGRRMVDASIVAAERKRVREATERTIRERELAPLQQKAQEADQLRAALDQVRPQIEFLRAHPEVLQQAASRPEEPAIPEAEAETYARRFELYDTNGKPDIARARAILTDSRREMAQVAQAAAQQAVAPMAQGAAQQASRQNFVAMASQRDANNQPVVDPKTLAELWTQFPPELTQHPEVARVILEAAVGRSALARGRSPVVTRDPLVTEPSGGRQTGAFTLTDLDRTVAKAAGMSDKAFEAQAKTYKPNTVNVIGD